MSRLYSRAFRWTGLLLALWMQPWVADAERDQADNSSSPLPPAVLLHKTLGPREPPMGLIDPSPRTVDPPESYALSIDGSLRLGGYVFKDGAPFIHTDGGTVYGNLAIGANALVSTTPGVPLYYSGTDNTAVGYSALRNNTEGSFNTAVGFYALSANTIGDGNTAVGRSALGNSTTGSDNTAAGVAALYNNTTGRLNAAFGFNALSFNTTGIRNTAAGSFALILNSTGSANTSFGYATMLGSATGSRNTALGYRAGRNNQSGSDNIWVANGGEDESNTLRIGSGTGAGDFQQNRAFVSGIRGITTGEADAQTVLIDGNGQLGTISSSRRFKEEIEDMAEASAGLADLRPVTFRYRRAFSDGDKPLRYGLIAEEVAEVVPELVSYDDDGRPDAVLYHLLTPMLLNELHRANRRIEVQQEELAELRALAGELPRVLARLERLEGQASD